MPLALFVDIALDGYNIDDCPPFELVGIHALRVCSGVYQQRNGGENVL